MKVEDSSGNVFRDLGLPNPERRLVEAERKRIEAKYAKLVEMCKSLVEKNPKLFSPLFDEALKAVTEEE